MKTEFEFTLPRGYIDSSGQIHRTGYMRLATAQDEIESLQDPRVLANEAYLPVVLLSRVVTRLGNLPVITPKIIETFFTADLASLEDTYLRLNSHQKVILGAICPQKCVNPKKSKVTRGCPLPLDPGRWNGTSRVFSGCKVRPNRPRRLGRT